MEPKSNLFESETDMIKGCLNQDRKMQELLYNTFSAKMYAVCLRYSSNEAEAQDLLQDGFVKIFKCLESYRKEGSFEGWIRRIFVNTSIEHYRKMLRKNDSLANQTVAFEDPSWSVLDSLEAKDLIALIQQLSPGYRQVFNMYAIEGYSHLEIANILGISEGTSKSQFSRAKAILQKFVKENFKTSIPNPN